MKMKFLQFKWLIHKKWINLLLWLKIIEVTDLSDVDFFYALDWVDEDDNSH